MAQHANSQKPKLVVAAALIGLAILTLLANVETGTIQVGCPVGALLGAVLQEIPCALVQAALQALQTCLFDHQVFLQDFQRMLVSFWLLFLLFAGMALTRPGLTSGSECSSPPAKISGK